MERKMLEAVKEIDAQIKKEIAGDNFYAALCLQKAREIIVRKMEEARA